MSNIKYHEKNLREIKENYSNRQFSDLETDNLVKLAVERELAKKYALKQPIAVYDRETGIVYAEYTDGTKIEVARSNKRK